MLAIFDIDGTICDSQGAEDQCFAEAVKRVTGKALDSVDWASFQEPTSSGIVRELLRGDSAAIAKERGIKEAFVEFLKIARKAYPGDFEPIAGVLEFIERIQSEGIGEVAIATGCFDSEAAYKLDCCGLKLSDFPHATSSDTPRRKEIIPLAAKRAGVPLSSCVYFGDASWDIQVSRELGLPLIGIGRRAAVFKEENVIPHFRDYAQPNGIVEELMRMKRRLI